TLATPATKLPLRFHRLRTLKADRWIEAKATTVEVVDGGGVGASVGVGRTGFDLVAGEHELLVTVTIAFPENAADDDDAKTGSVYLSGLAVILSQTL
uniref:hypothetical protein n=1 Tax=Cryobacterium sp. Y50 TaxID=2048286 RepID=UPI00130485FB